MSAHYDSMVDQYVAYAGASPTRPIEVRTLLQLAGPLQGRDVLDLACGSGYYGRVLLRHGARSAVGVDQSQGMIDFARALSRHSNDDMQFHTRDVLDMADIGTFDIVVAAWLFNYAECPATLQAMFAAVERHLKPGGRLVVQTFNPDYRLALGDYAQYGVKVLEEQPWQDGARLRLQFPGTPPAQVTNYRWPRTHYEEAAVLAGFARPQWHEPQLDAEDVARHPPGYWNDYVHNCMSVNLLCQR
ncbi:MULTISPECIES: class I SAM-dependent methyltransferase [Stenotrophomonas]|uniref:class I SAM-dependent methyltransferase n=1 Tax=Stenotrophomonas TaxID=40323 RepID=UPI000D53F639|nr:MULTISPECIES: class I SAM-dependent methyltransferase [Stenotrophomonas]AWH32296.1 class I SAM-dependent methyltransferase [Stenotrophomonas sp. SAU14A_NAIMI4_8]